MKNSHNTTEELSRTNPIIPEPLSQAAQQGFNIKAILKKLRGGLFFIIGYLLSPLCWWNDLFFNLPVAYGFGYVCSLLSPSLLMPCSIVGYWISNIAGILLMQAGAIDVLQNQPQERNLKKELLTGLVSSTVYTLLILALIQFKILDTPLLFGANIPAK